MTVTALAPQTHNLRERALILRGVAGEWDNLVGAFSAHWDRQDTALLERFMRNLIAPYVHPDNYGQRMTDLTHQLVTQVKALSDYHTYGVLPDTLDEAEAYGAAPAEVLVGLMEGDIDLTLFEMLHGSVHPCRECRRTHANVWTWRVSEYPRSLYCTECKAARTGAAL